MLKEKIVEIIKEDNCTVDEVMNTVMAFYIQGWVDYCKKFKLSASQARKMVAHNLMNIERNFYDAYKELKEMDLIGIQKDS